MLPLLTILFALNTTPTPADATLALTRGMPGHMFAVGNHIPANVPDAMCLRYMDYLRANWMAL